jgi:hypothetical protein
MASVSSGAVSPTGGAQPTPSPLRQRTLIDSPRGDGSAPTVTAGRSTPNRRSPRGFTPPTVTLRCGEGLLGCPGRRGARRGLIASVSSGAVSPTGGAQPTPSPLRPRTLCCGDEHFGTSMAVNRSPAMSTAGMSPCLSVAARSPAVGSRDDGCTGLKGRSVAPGEAVCTWRQEPSGQQTTRNDRRRGAGCGR